LSRGELPNKQPDAPGTRQNSGARSTAPYLQQRLILAQFLRDGRTGRAARVTEVFGIAPEFRVVNFPDDRLYRVLLSGAIRIE
jgi:hypothetical protein